MVKTRGFEIIKNDVGFSEMMHNLSKHVTHIRSWIFDMGTPQGTKLPHYTWTDVTKIVSVELTFLIQ